LDQVNKNKTIFKIYFTNFKFAKEINNGLDKTNPRLVQDLDRCSKRNLGRLA
jgi:hypothetical protein